MHVIKSMSYFWFKICQNCDPIATNTFDAIFIPSQINFTFEIQFSRPILLHENYLYKNKHSSPTKLHIAPD